MFLLRRLFRIPPPVPQSFRYEYSWYALDGGTTLIAGWDEYGRQRELTVTPWNRLYLDWYRVRRSSRAEREILSLVRQLAGEFVARSCPLEEVLTKNPGDLTHDELLVYRTWAFIKRVEEPERWRQDSEEDEDDTDDES